MSDEVIINKDEPVEQIKTLATVGGNVNMTLIESVAAAEKYVELQSRMRQISVNVTNTEDWVSQGDSAYLEWTGASKIARCFGVSYDPPEFERRLEHDDEGEYIVYECIGTVRWSGQSMVEIGTGSSRDSFFGVRGGQRLPLCEVDLNNIKKKAMTNWLNRGIKSLLGLSFTWDEISEATKGRITKEKCSCVKYAQGTRGGKADSSPVTADTRSKVWKMIMDMAGGDPTAAAKHLSAMTTWKNKEGVSIPGKTKITDVSEAQLKYLEKDTLKEYAEWQKLREGANAVSTPEGGQK